MKEEQHNINYFQLIPRYLSGNITDQEIKLLEEWVLASSENKEHFNSFKKAWILAGVNKINKSIDINKEWEKISEKVFNSNKSKIHQIESESISKFRIGYFVRVAAAVVLLFVTSFWVYNNLINDNLTDVTAYTSIEEAVLPDGSSVSINQNSTISYPEVNNKKHRLVELKGDAFFEVVRDTNQSFIVSTDEIEIEVLGTSFYVDARKNLNQIMVIVKSGSVAVKSQNAKVILSTNEVGVYDRINRTLIKEKNDNVNYLAWKTGLLLFEKSTLEEVVFDINRKFNSKITIGNSSIKTCEITATFDNKSLDSIIKIIEKTLKISTVKKGEKIVFVGQSCE